MGYNVGEKLKMLPFEKMLCDRIDQICKNPEKFLKIRAKGKNHSHCLAIKENNLALAIFNNKKSDNTILTESPKQKVNVHYSYENKGRNSSDYEKLCKDLNEQEWGWPSGESACTVELEQPAQESVAFERWSGFFSEEKSFNGSETKEILCDQEKFKNSKKGYPIKPDITFYDDERQYHLELKYIKAHSTNKESISKLKEQLSIDENLKSSELFSAPFLTDDDGTIVGLSDVREGKWFVDFMRLLSIKNESACTYFCVFLRIKDKCYKSTIINSLKEFWDYYTTNSTIHCYTHGTARKKNTITDEKEFELNRHVFPKTLKKIECFTNIDGEYKPLCINADKGQFDFVSNQKGKYAAFLLKITR